MFEHKPVPCVTVPSQTPPVFKKNRSVEINHPKYYGGESNVYECIKVIEAWDLGFHLGNAIKYINRAGKKTGDPTEDLKKAIWYIQRYIEKK